MNLNEVIAKINEFDAGLAALKKVVIDFAAGTGGGAIPPPVVAAPTPQYPPVDANGLLMHARQVGNARVDPVVPEGTPNTVKMGVTGHVLSVARPDLGEMFIGYCTRVADQAQGNPGTVGALFLGSSQLFERFGERYDPAGSNWPRAADYFYNMRAYMTPEERARDDANKAAWGNLYK